ncbi:retrotransposon protein, putative, ty1-copia subclass [Tanacetum coccineum]
MPPTLGLLRRSEAMDDDCHTVRSRYGYVYLLKHKHEVFETFKVFKNEVENQLGKTIKAIRSDRGGEYCQEFKDYLKANGIVQQLTTLQTQHNGVSRRGETVSLLDMVRSYDESYTLIYSFGIMLLESATRHSQYGFQLRSVALVKRDTPDKLQQRSVKCIFIGYPKETMGYYFYFPPENKIVVARYAEFFEKNLITQEVSGRAIDLEEIQDEDTSPSEITSEIPMEVEGFEPPQEEVISIRRSERTHRAPNRLCLNVEVEEHSLGDLNEPTSYKAAMLDSESNKWIDAMNAEIQSMIDNMVWVLVDLPPNCKTVRTIKILISIAAFYDYKVWQMDVKTAFLNGNLDEDIYMVQPKGFVDPNHPKKVSGSNGTFLILYVDDIIIMGNHIPSLQSVKDYIGKYFAMKDLGEVAFILGIKIYRDRSKRLIRLGQNAYMDKILKKYKMDNSKGGYIPMQERLDINKTQGASTPKEVTCMQNVPYASAMEAELRVDCYCNTGFEVDIDDMKSLIGYLLKKAEMEVVWIRKFILGFGVVPTINEPIRIFYDNSAVLLIANELGVQMGTRHYHRSNLLKVHTDDDNMADSFTKPLSKGKLTQHARTMGLCLASCFT